MLYQQGQFIEQWTIAVHDDTPAGKELGLIKVRNSPHFKDLIEFEVELEAIPVADHRSKDVTVNWKFYDGFDPKGAFFTDSNALEMQSRHKVFLRLDEAQESNEAQATTPNHFTISGNFYPVDSAIAMRDRSGRSNYQVTIMNDRPQGGSADLSDSATIELMQNRRTVWDDKLGLQEPLNDTNWEMGSNKATNRYWMQIFDHKRGASLQRQTQEQLAQQLKYLHAGALNLSSRAQSQAGAMPPVDSLVRVFPLERNELLIRAANLGDVFDRAAAPQHLDVRDYAIKLYEQANNGAQPKDVKIEE